MNQEFIKRAKAIRLFVLTHGWLQITDASQLIHDMAKDEPCRWTRVPGSVWELSCGSTWGGGTALMDFCPRCGRRIEVTP